MNSFWNVIILFNDIIHVQFYTIFPKDDHINTAIDILIVLSIPPLQNEHNPISASLS